MFKKEERAGFKYTFAHWCAFQMTALNLGIWKFKYLFHDIEKPFLKLLWKDYSKVQKWHRTHNPHHVEYAGKWDIDAMIIDWECSRFTKESAKLNAYEKCLEKINDNSSDIIAYTLENYMIPRLKELGLTKNQ
jgi:hypothetical protein